MRGQRLLRISNLHVAYGAAVAVRRVNINVLPGTAVCLLGPNGAGKSSILKSISGLVQPSQGRIEFEGKDLCGRDPADIVRLGVHQVPEGRSVFPDLTVRENLELGTFIAPRRATKALVAEAFASFPVLERKQSDRAGSLSGGEQQILAIARALLVRPRLLLLDEPSLGIAPLIVTEIFKTLAEVRRGGTTLLIAEQDASAALTLASYGYVLQVGSVALEGTSRELSNDETVRRSYFGDY